MIPFAVRLIAGFGATLLFGVLLRQPKRTLPYSAGIGCIGYAVFISLSETTIAYFTAALIVGILCECTARIKKMTTTLFLTSAIIPLVPGLGLYRTMLHIVQEHYEAAAKTGTETLLVIFAIALAVTISTLFFTNLRLNSSHRHVG